MAVDIRVLCAPSKSSLAQNGKACQMKSWDPSQELFNRLLEWLDADRDAAGEKYETIRRHLIKNKGSV